MQRDEKGGYTLGAKLLQMGSDYNVQAPLREMARESLWELWRVTKETVNLAVLDGVEVVYIDCLESPHDFRLVSNGGMRAVLNRTALGKALLAFQPPEHRERLIKSLHFQAFTPHTLTSAEELSKELTPIRQSCYAVDNEESVLGLRCIAAPILDKRGNAVAAISISGPPAGSVHKNRRAGESREGCRSRGVGSDGKSARHGITTLTRRRRGARQTGKGTLREGGNP